MTFVTFIFLLVTCLFCISARGQTGETDYFFVVERGTDGGGLSAEFAAAVLMRALAAEGVNIGVIGYGEDASVLCPLVPAASYPAAALERIFDVRETSAKLSAASLESALALAEEQFQSMSFPADAKLRVVVVSGQQTPASAQASAVENAEIYYIAVGEAVDELIAAALYVWQIDADGTEAALTELGKAAAKLDPNVKTLFPDNTGNFKAAPFTTISNAAAVFADARTGDFTRGEWSLLETSGASSLADSASGAAAVFAYTELPAVLFTIMYAAAAAVLVVFIIMICAILSAAKKLRIPEWKVEYAVNDLPQGSGAVKLAAKKDPKDTKVMPSGVSIQELCEKLKVDPDNVNAALAASSFIKKDNKAWYIEHPEFTNDEYEEEENAENADYAQREIVREKLSQAVRWDKFFVDGESGFALKKISRKPL